MKQPKFIPVRWVENGKTFFGISKVANGVRTSVRAPEGGIYFETQTKRDMALRDLLEDD